MVSIPVAIWVQCVCMGGKEWMGAASCQADHMVGYGQQPPTFICWWGCASWTWGKGVVSCAAAGCMWWTHPQRRLVSMGASCRLLGLFLRPEAAPSWQAHWAVWLLRAKHGQCPRHNGVCMSPCCSQLLRSRRPVAACCCWRDSCALACLFASAVAPLTRLPPAQHAAYRHAGVQLLSARLWLRFAGVTASTLGAQVTMLLWMYEMHLVAVLFLLFSAFRVCSSVCIMCWVGRAQF
jgi:hypothetical protein